MHTKHSSNEPVHPYYNRRPGTSVGVPLKKISKNVEQYNPVHQWFFYNSVCRSIGTLIGGIPLPGVRKRTPRLESDHPLRGFSQNPYGIG
jgi:hypothetical protein